MGRVCGSVEKRSKAFYARRYRKQVVLVRHGDTLRLFSFLPSAHVKEKHLNLTYVVSTCCKPARSRPAETLRVPLRDSDLLSFGRSCSFAEDLVARLKIGRKGCSFSPCRCIPNFFRSSSLNICDGTRSPKVVGRGSEEKSAELNIAFLNARGLWRFQTFEEACSHFFCGT